MHTASYLEDGAQLPKRAAQGDPVLLAPARLISPIFGQVLHAADNVLQPLWNPITFLVLVIFRGRLRQGGQLARIVQLGNRFSSSFPHVYIVAIQERTQHFQVALYKRGPAKLPGGHCC